MNLSEIGKIVAIEWQKTFELRPDMNLTMGEYVVMPNHFHAIISIGENVYNTPPKCDDAQYPRRDAMHCVSTVTDTINTTTPFKNKFGPQSKNLASIIRGFKSAVTTNARKWQKTQPIVDVCTTFAWQPNYHDHIIRNEKSFQNISQYIVNNPIKWKEDTFHPKNHNTNK